MHQTVFYRRKEHVLSVPFVGTDWAVTSLVIRGRVNVVLRTIASDPNNGESGGISAK